MKKVGKRKLGNGITTILKRIIQFVMGFLIINNHLVVPKNIITPPNRVLAETKKPNVIFVFFDEMRYESLPWEDPFVTAPNLEKMYREGICLDHAYTSNPVCSPARACMITGMYSTTHGILANDRYILNPDITSIGKIFKENGYSTGYIGKWHLDGVMVDNVPQENRQGFDFWAAFNKGHNYWNSTYYLNDNPNPINVNDRYEPDYQTDIAIDFINNNKDDPFALYMSWGPPHTPHYPPSNFDDPNFQNLDPLDTNIKNRPNVSQTEYQRAQYENAGYNTHIKLLDANLGRLFNAVNAAGIENDTIVVVTSDHGELAGAQGLFRKGWQYEEAIHIPFLIKYPAKLPQNVLNHSMISTVDFAPSILGLCGLSVPRDMEGIDISRALIENDPLLAPEAIYIQGAIGSTREFRTIRTNTFMYTCILDGNNGYRVTPYNLYNMENDKYQTTNLVNNAEYSEIQSNLHNKIYEFANKINDQRLLNPEILIEEGVGEELEAEPKPNVTNLMEGTMYYNEDFENYKHGVQLSELGWQVKSNDENIIARVENDGSNNYLYLKAGSKSSATFEYTLPALNGKLVYEAMYKFNNTVYRHVPNLIGTLKNGTTGTVTSLFVTAAGKFAINSAPRNLFPDTNKWTHVRMVIDFSNNTTEFYFDDKLYQKRDFVSPGKNISKIRVLFHPNASMYIDDIKIYSTSTENSAVSIEMNQNLIPEINTGDAIKQPQTFKDRLIQGFRQIIKWMTNVLN